MGQDAPIAHADQFGGWPKVGARRVKLARVTAQPGETGSSGED